MRNTWLHTAHRLYDHASDVVFQLIRVDTHILEMLQNVRVTAFVPNVISLLILVVLELVALFVDCVVREVHEQVL